MYATDSSSVNVQRYRPDSLFRTTTCQLMLMLHQYSCDPGIVLSTHLGSVLGSNLKRSLAMVALNFEACKHDRQHSTQNDWLTEKVRACRDGSSKKCIV